MSARRMALSYLTRTRTMSQYASLKDLQAAEFTERTNVITALESELAQVVEPVAYAIFSETGNVRIWAAKQPHLKSMADSWGATLVSLYAAPQEPAAPDVNAELLEALKYARRMVNASECDIAYIDAAITKAEAA